MSGFHPDYGITDEDRRRVLHEMRRNGWSVRRASRETGWSRKAIQNWIDAMEGDHGRNRDGSLDNERRAGEGSARHNHQGGGAQGGLAVAHQEGGRRKAMSNHARRGAWSKYGCRCGSDRAQMEGA